MSEVTSALAENFSLTRGGPLSRFLLRLDPAANQRDRTVLRAFLAVIITWLPLLVFSLMQGLAYNPQIRIPFFRDFAVHIRFLFALPILILAESPIDQRWRTLVLQFLKSGLVSEHELPAFEAVIGTISRLRDRLLPEGILLAAAFLPSLLAGNGELLMNGASDWHFVGGIGGLSLAGWWFKFVSTPLFRFLLFRWIWKMFLWALFLWRVSRIGLHLVATHTDMAAGLGFLSLGQKSFGSVVFAGGAVIAAQVGNAIAYEGQTLSSLKFVMIAYGVLAVLLLVAPLFAVTPVLLKVKRKALLDYGALVSVHNQLFDAKWIRKDNSDEQVILGNPDPSSLIDLGSSFIVVRQMALVPVDRNTFITLAMAAVLPMVPVVLFVTPADQIIRLVMKMLG
jgi:hypothetical protein